MFHRGGGTFGSAWGDGFAASVGGGTLRAAVGSSVGASGGGATLRSWGGGLPWSLVWVPPSYLAADLALVLVQVPPL